MTSTNSMFDSFNFIHELAYSVRKKKTSDANERWKGEQGKNNGISLMWNHINQQ